MESVQEGLCCFIVKKINQIYHFLVQAKIEPGNFDVLEFAPTIQCLTGNYRNSENKLPYLNLVLNCSKNRIIFDTYQSEEGGRFFREQNRNMIILADDEVDVKTPHNYIWMTLNQLNSFLSYNNYVNIQARSLIAAIQFF